MKPDKASKENLREAKEILLEIGNIEKENIRIVSQALQSHTDREEELSRELTDYKANNNAAKWNELLGKRMDRIKELETLLYSTVTPEWKSAAFQKIKGLEAEIAQLKSPEKIFPWAIKLKTEAIKLKTESQDLIDYAADLIKERDEAKKQSEALVMALEAILTKGREAGITYAAFIAEIIIIANEAVLAYRKEQGNG